jgi:hypothetical protein
MRQCYEAQKEKQIYAGHQVSNASANWLMKKNEDLGEMEEVMLAGLDNFRSTLGRDKRAKFPPIKSHSFSCLCLYLPEPCKIHYEPLL